MSKKVLQADITVTRTDGGWIHCSAMVDGYRVSSRFLYYTKREAVRRFQARINGMEVDA